MLEQQRESRTEIPLSATPPESGRSVLEQINVLRNRARQHRQAQILRVSYKLPNVDPWRYLAISRGHRDHEEAFVAAMDGIDISILPPVPDAGLIPVLEFCVAQKRQAL
ncbi:MAG: hypothetical protein ACPG77_04120, partial [Nannocystaceae bacterium]